MGGKKAPKSALLFGLVTTVYVGTGAIMTPDIGTYPCHDDLATNRGKSRGTKK